VVEAVVTFKAHSSSSRATLAARQEQQQQHQGSSLDNMLQVQQVL
jgi:hypothetical protein